MALLIFLEIQGQDRLLMGGGVWIMGRKLENSNRYLQ